MNTNDRPVEPHAPETKRVAEKDAIRPANEPHMKPLEIHANLIGHSAAPRRAQ